MDYKIDFWIFTVSTFKESDQDDEVRIVLGFVFCTAYSMRPRPFLQQSFFRIVIFFKSWSWTKIVYGGLLSFESRFRF